MITAWRRFLFLGFGRYGREMFGFVCRGEGLWMADGEWVIGVACWITLILRVGKTDRMDGWMHR